MESTSEQWKWRRKGWRRRGLDPVECERLVREEGATCDACGSGESGKRLWVVKETPFGLRRLCGSCDGRVRVMLRYPDVVAWARRLGLLESTIEVGWCVVHGYQSYALGVCWRKHYEGHQVTTACRIVDADVSVLVAEGSDRVEG